MGVWGKTKQFLIISDVDSKRKFDVIVSIIAVIDIIIVYALPLLSLS